MEGALPIMQSSIWNELQGVELKQTWYDAGGIRTRVIEAGSGYPLFLLHGTGGHAEAYSRNIAAHAEHFRVIAYDMVGHGYTDARVVVLENSAHWPQWEEPEAFNRAHIEFLLG